MVLIVERAVVSVSQLGFIPALPFELLQGSLAREGSSNTCSVFAGTGRKTLVDIFLFYFVGAGHSLPKVFYHALSC